MSTIQNPELNVTVTPKALSAAFDRLAPFVPRRSRVTARKPLLRYVRLRADRTTRTLTIDAGDGDQRASVTISGVEVSQYGLACVPFKALRDAVKAEKQAETIRLEADRNAAQLRGERTTRSLPAADPQNYPPSVTAAGAVSTIEVDAIDLRDAIARSLPATDKTSSRYALGGVSLSVDDNRSLELVAVDGRRLHLSTIPTVTNETSGAFSSRPETPGDDTPTRQQAAILPLATAKALAKLLPAKRCKTGYRVTITRDASQLTFAASEGAGTPWRVECGILDGRFPQWRDVIPSRTDSTIAEVSAGELGATVAALLPSVSPTHRGATVALWEAETAGGYGQQNGAAWWRAGDPEEGETTAHMALTTYAAGDDYPTKDRDGVASGIPGKQAPAQPSECVVTCLQPQFLIDALASLPADATLSLDIADAVSPVVLTAHGSGIRGTFSAVLMPVALDVVRPTNPADWRVPGAPEDWQPRCVREAEDAARLAQWIDDAAAGDPGELAEPTVVVPIEGEAEPVALAVTPF